MTKKRKRYRRPRCPKCDSAKTVPIVYGMPSYEAFKKQEEGRLVLGGCVIEDDSPDRHCKKCGHEFRRSDGLDILDLTPLT